MGNETGDDMEKRKFEEVRNAVAAELADNLRAVLASQDLEAMTRAVGSSESAVHRACRRVLGPGWERAPSSPDLSTVGEQMAGASRRLDFVRRPSYSSMPPAAQSFKAARELAESVSKK